MLDTNTIVASNDYSGFKNYSAVSFSTVYAGGTIASGGYTGPIRATTALNNTNAVTAVQVQYTNIETFYRQLPGYSFVDYPSAGTRTYQIQSFSYFTGGNLIIDSYISNQTGNVVAPGPVTVPAITFNCRAFLYSAPF